MLIPFASHFPEHRTQTEAFAPPTMHLHCRDAIKKLKAAVSTETLESTVSESSGFWSLTAIDLHRAGIRRLNQSLSQHQPAALWAFVESRL